MMTTFLDINIKMYWTNSRFTSKASPWSMMGKISLYMYNTGYVATVHMYMDRCNLASIARPQLKTFRLDDVNAVVLNTDFTPSLEHLTLGNELGNHAVISFAGNISFPALKYMSFSRCRVGDWIYEMLATAIRLEECHLWGVKFEVSGRKKLEFKSRVLREIDFDSCKGLEEVSAHDASNLKIKGFRSCGGLKVVDAVSNLEIWPTAKSNMRMIVNIVANSCSVSRSKLKLGAHRSSGAGLRGFSFGIEGSFDLTGVA